MRWNRMAAAAMAVAPAVIGAQTALADVIVVRSNGPSAARLPPGKTLPDSTRLTLRDGDRIVVLDAHGTRTLAGPGTFSAAGDPSRPPPTAMGAIMGPSTTRRTRVGAVRSMGRPPLAVAAMRPGIFLVDVAAPGKVCVVDATAVTLWRGDPRAPATTTLTASDGRSATVDWIVGQDTSPWPAALPVAPGARYRLSPAAAGAPTMVEFQLLATPPANLQQLASGLIAHGCQGQVDVLVATTAATPAPATGG